MGARPQADRVLQASCLVIVGQSLRKAGLLEDVASLPTETRKWGITFRTRKIIHLNFGFQGKIVVIDLDLICWELCLATIFSVID